MWFEIPDSLVCASSRRGQRVPAVLAAYIARVILEANPAQFSPDAELSADDVDELIRLAIARLCETDAPALETIKMQVAFDSTYVRFEEELDAAKKARDDKKRELVHAILAARRRRAASLSSFVFRLSSCDNTSKERNTKENPSTRARVRKERALSRCILRGDFGGRLG